MQTAGRSQLLLARPGSPLIVDRVTSIISMNATHSVFLFLLLAHFHSVALAQDPSDQTSPFDDVFATETDQPPATPSFPPGPDIYFGPGPGPGGGGNPSPGTPSLPGILRGLIRGGGTSGAGPCNGGGTPASDRQLFEILVYRGVCANDGVSPGTSRVCADLPAVRPNQSLLGRSPCLVPPPLSAPIWRNVINCAYSNFLHKDATLAPNYRAGSTRSSYPPQTACQIHVVQTTCADVNRLKNTPPYSDVYASQITPYSSVALGPIYNQANYIVNLPGQVPAGVEPGASEQANALSRFGQMARYCRGLNPQLIAAAPKLQRQEPKLDTRTDSPDPTKENQRIYKLGAKITHVYIPAPYYNGGKSPIQGTLKVQISTDPKDRHARPIKKTVDKGGAFSWAWVQLDPDPHDDSQGIVTVIELIDLSGRHIGKRDFRMLGLPMSVHFDWPRE